MKNKGRNYVWISILLINALCISDNIPIWADMEETVAEEIVSVNGLEDHADSDLFSEAKDNESVSVFEDSIQDEDSISINIDSSQRETWMSESVNKYNEGEYSIENNPEQDEKLETVSMDQTQDLDKEESSEALSENQLIVSDNQAVDEELHRKAIDVILPANVSFNMLFIGDERRKGCIASKTFCIENKGYDDVCISFEGICHGFATEDYVISNTSVRDNFVKSKKNVWIYLKWKDEKGEIANLPQIIMGDASAPGKGQIILKAPKRNGEGENPESKAYFSFEGDLISDTDEIWRDGELELSLNFNIETLGTAKPADTETRKNLAKQTDRTNFITDSNVANQSSQSNISENSVSNNYGQDISGEDESDNKGE